MSKLLIVIYIFLLALYISPLDSFAQSSQTVEFSQQTKPLVLLHGLARRASSMKKLAKTFAEYGYEVCNINYPSRKHTITTLTDEFVVPAIQTCISDSTKPIEFITHSMGGIILRQLAATHPSIPIGRVVMLSPPNHGSEVVDKMGGWFVFKFVNGPAGSQLSTDANSIPNTLGKPDFEFAVITGNRSINPILSWMIPNEDDGKVSIESAKLDGMQDFLVVPYSHTFIMRKEEVIEQSYHFLQHGKFQ